MTEINPTSSFDVGGIQVVVSGYNFLNSSDTYQCGFGTPGVNEIRVSASLFANDTTRVRCSANPGWPSPNVSVNFNVYKNGSPIVSLFNRTNAFFYQGICTSAQCNNNGICSQGNCVRKKKKKTEKRKMKNEQEKEKE